MKNTHLRQAIVAILATSTLSAFADDNAPLHVTLDPLVVTFSKNAQPLSKTPARVSRIGLDDIQANPTLNLSDVLKYDASTFNRSQWGGIGQPSSLSVRGTNATHTLVLKDGARLNSQNGTAPLYPAFLDLTDVEQVEILKGVASVQYGSDAIGGVVQMISKTPTKTGTSLTGIWGENNTHKTIAQGDFVANNGLYATISGQRLNSDGNRIFDTQPESEKAGYEQKGYNAKIGYKQEKLDLLASVSQNKGVNKYSNSGWQPVIKIDSQRTFENNITNLKATYAIADNIIVSARHTIVKDKQKIDTPTENDHYNTNHKDSDLNLRWSFTPNQNLLVGASHLTSNYASSQITSQKQTTNSTGYYAQHQYNSHKFNTQIGVRLEDNEQFGRHTVGQGAVRYHINQNTSIYANVGSAFRAPTLDEMYSTWYKNNPDLKSEQGLSREFGFNHQLTPNTTLQFSTFDTKVKDLIRTGCVNNCNSQNWWERETQYINIDKASFKGQEIGLKWASNDVFILAQYARINAKNTETGKVLAYRPKHNGVLTVGYDNGKYGFNTALNVHSKSFANNPNTIKVSGYGTLDVNTHWHISPHIKAFGSIQNIGNIQYKSSYYGPQWYVNGGRQANIGITLSY